MAIWPMPIAIVIAFARPLDPILLALVHMIAGRRELRPQLVDLTLVKFVFLIALPRAQVSARCGAPLRFLDFVVAAVRADAILFGFAVIVSRHSAKRFARARFRLASWRIRLARRVAIAKLFFSASPFSTGRV